MPITPKKQRFIDRYLIDLNATQAAKDAGYSEKTAYSQGQRLLKDVEVADQIQKSMDNRSKKMKLSAARVLDEISSLAFSNLQDYIKFDDDGKPFIADLKNLTREQAAAIQEIWVDKAGLTRFKLADKGQNLERLAKHLQLFSDKITVDVSDPIKALLNSVATNGARIGGS